MRTPASGGRRIIQHKVFPAAALSYEEPDLYCELAMYKHAADVRMR